MIREARGRDHFNKDHASMWQKKKLQTGYDTVKTHENAAKEAAQNARFWRDQTQLHGHYLGVYDQDVSSTGGSASG